MTSESKINSHDGMTLRQAALVTGIAYLTNPITYAEYIYPKLVVSHDIEQTVRNITAHNGQFVAMVFCYFIQFVGDIVIAWALYILLAPRNRSLSLLASLFQLMYAAVSLSTNSKLFTVFRLLHTPEYLQLFGAGPLHAQIDLLLHAYQYDWSISLVLFGIHLMLLGYLILRCGYIPWIIGLLLMIDGLGWVVDSVKPYLFPNANLGWISITFLGELVFMLWLLIRGWKIQEQS